MSNELIQVNPETGEVIETLAPLPAELPADRALSIQQAFTPLAADYAALADIYPQFVGQEITPELVDLATEFKKRLAKTRNGIAKVHKSEKAFFLHAGKFVDAIKNKFTKPIEEMEENIELIITHFDRLAAAERAKIRDARWAELSQHTDNFPGGLDVMSEESYQMLLAGAKAQKEAARLAQIEAERLAKIEADKRDEEARQAAVLRAELLKTRMELERVEREKAAIEREKAEAAAREAAEAARKREEAAEAARQPIKKQIERWVDSFELPIAPVNDPAVEVIIKKFIAYKQWAKTQI